MRIPMPTRPEFDAVVRLGNEAYIRVLEGAESPAQVAFDVNNTINDANGFAVQAEPNYACNGLGSIFLAHSWQDAEDLAVLDNIIERFRRVCPLVIIETQPLLQSQFVQQFTVADESGFRPTFGLVPQTQLMQLLAPDPLVKNVNNVLPSSMLQRFTPVGIEAMRSQSNLFGLPFVLEVDALYYNRQLVTTPAQTVDDLRSQSMTGIPIILNTDFEKAFWGLHAFGGNLFADNGAALFDQGGMADWLLWLRESRDSYGIQLSSDGDEILRSFLAGESAYLVAGADELAELQEGLGEELGIALLPSGPAGTAQPLVQAQGFVLREDITEAAQSLAVEFMGFATDIDSQNLLMNEAQKIPVNANVSTVNSPFFTILVEQAQTGFLLPNASFWQPITELGKAAYEDVLDNGLDPTEVVTELTDAINRANGIVVTPTPTVSAPNSDILRDEPEATATEECQCNWRWYAFARFFRGTHAAMNDPRLQALLDQLDTLFLVLERPVVQNQLIAFLALTLLSWLLPIPLGAVLKRLIAQQDAISKRRQKLKIPVNIWRTRLLRWLRGAQLLLFPIVGLISSQLIFGYFASRSWPVGLLQRLATVFWLVLIYQFGGSILFGSLPAERARAYHRRLVTPIFVILTAVSVTAGLAGAFPIFSIELFRVADTPLMVSTIINAALVLYATVAIGWLTNQLLRNLVFPRGEIDSGVTNTILIISRYATIAIGVLLAFSILGVDLSSFAIIGGGLSVGIGFGLQDLIANFISGILLLFEQTLRPGDVIEVSGQRGRVNQMRMRSAVLRTADNVDIYVPNKTLLTSTVAAYTNVKPTTRKTINVGVSYDSDPIEVRNTLQGVVENHGLVLKEPAPSVFFIGFGSFTLDFQIAVSIGDPGRTAQILSDLHFMIFREFTKRGIEIPIPQQDFHLRTDFNAPIEHLLSTPSVESDLAQRSNGESQQPHRKHEKSPQQLTNKDGALDPKSAASTSADKSLTQTGGNATTEKPKVHG